MRYILFLSIFIFMIVVCLFGQELTSSIVCAECHTDAYSEWRSSRHSQSSASSNPFFSAMYEWAKSADADLQKACLKCHEPVLFLNTSENSPREGVTCDICHAAKPVPGNGGWWLKIQPGNIKFGTIQDAISNWHTCEYSPIHGEARLCLVCHSSLTSEHGIEFCSTEEEWKQSSFAQKGVNCQDCHMPVIEGKTAPVGKIRDDIHLHNFYGGYSEDFLRNCAEIDIQTKKQNSSFLIAVTVTNKTVGHSLPTGSPMRMVILSLELRDREQRPLWKNWYNNPLAEDAKAVFMRLLEDENGKAPVPPWQASQMRFDQRLKADESRLLEYTVSDTSAHSLNATLIYRLAPPALLEKMQITDPIYSEPKIIVEENVLLSQ